MDTGKKSTTSGIGSATSNNTATSTLKEMLKINASDLFAVDDSFVDPADRVLDDGNTESKMASNMKFQSTKSKDSNVYQEILLENIEDGANVQLSGIETRISTNLNTEIDCSPPASNKVTFTNITKFEWDHRYYEGNLISVTDKFMAYSLKGHVSNSVRVINRQNSSDRTLLKGFSGAITDVAFSHAHSNILAAVDNAGNFLVWILSDTGGSIEADLKLHLVGEKNVYDNPVLHRLVWIPYIPNSSTDNGNQSEPLDLGVAGIMTLFYNDVAEVWDINLAFELAKDIGDIKLMRAQIDQAFTTVADNVGAITDCELSPFGNVLAIASSDGFVKFWQVDPNERPSCLHQWRPHDGRPLSAVRFCDDPIQEEPRVYWRFLLTSCDKNTELKMWCAVSWRCLQVLYVMQIETSLEQEKASIVSLSHYTLTLPILSMAIVDAEKSKFNFNTIATESPTKSQKIVDYFSDNDDSKLTEEDKTDSSEEVDGYVVKLLTIQRRSLQNLEVRFVLEDDNSDLQPNIKNHIETADGSSIDAKGRSKNLSNCSREAEEASTRDSDMSNAFLSAENVSSFSKKSASLSNQKPKDESLESEISPSQKILHTAQAPASGDGMDRDLPSTASNPSTPILLTPDAFMGIHKSTGKHNEVPSSNNMSSSFKVEEDSSFQKNKDTGDSLLGVFQDTSKSVLSTKTPPSSPAFPQPTQTESVQTPIDIVELFQSFRSRPTVMSPDLISSTATSDDVKHEIVPPTTLSAPPGLPARPLDAASPLSDPHSSNVFASLLLPVSTTSNSWPKAPDVTMSHLLPASSQSTAGTSLVTSASTGSVVSMSGATSTAQLPHNNTRNNDDDGFAQTFAEIRRQNEEIFHNQKLKLDEILTKQNQIKNNIEVSRKHSDQIGDRLQKAVTSVSGNQLQLSNDVKSGQSTVTEAMVSKIDRAVKAEIKRTVLPGVTTSIGEIREKLSSTVAQQLSATDSVLKETISKSVKSKDLVDKVVFELTKLLQDRIQSVLPNIFMQTIVPSFERTCQTMFQQLASTYHKGMEETVKQLEKQMQFRLKSEYDKMQQITNDASDTVRQLQNASKQVQSEITRNVQQQLSRNTQDILKRFEDTISSRLLRSIKQQQDEESAKQRRLIIEALQGVVSQTLDEKLSVSRSMPVQDSSSIDGLQLGNPSSLRHTSTANQQEQILKILQQGDVNKAFQTALNAANLSLVLFVCETANPEMIFNVVPCPLQQPILLSLIQQLSNELNTKTDLKLRYLQESVMNLDRKHEVTKEYMHSVLGTLVQNLNAAAAEPNQVLSKQLRMLSMAAQSLMG